MTPREIVDELDKHIIGQKDAKRAVAIALRNRWRRMKVAEPMRSEITPKNILMIGPTGVGKTEIARRLARLADAPFVKVEATKYTEVGFVGRDVESIIRELMELSVKMTREKAVQASIPKAEKAAQDRILDILLRKPEVEEKDETADKTREIFRERLIKGELDDREIEIDVAELRRLEIMGPPGMEDMTDQLQNIFKSIGADKKKARRAKVKKAFKVLQEEEAAKLVNDEEIREQARKKVEQTGIVFIDEIDKVTARSERQGADVSREGVQRDLLPLVEGCTVNTKHGIVKTDHILFIASGAFHLTKPSDLIPELQGRLPIRVELNALTIDDFKRILTEPDASLTQQYHALLNTEGVTLVFEKSAVEKIAEASWQVNERTENIGARRLHTVMERLMETISYEACDKPGQTITIDKVYVEKHLGNLIENEDLSRYIL